MLDLSRSAKLPPMENGAKAARRNKAKDLSLTLLSILLLVLAFPDFNLWPLAWLGLVPLLVAIARKPAPRRAFFLGWFFGGAFFYATCYWLTYSIIHYGGLSPWQAYALLFPGALILGLFPGLFALIQARFITIWGPRALFAAPLLWVALEWARLSVTGQLWNAIGYSQAFHPTFIQVARWGGVYAVGFLIVTVNAAIAFALLKQTARALLISSLIVAGAGGLLLVSGPPQSFARPVLSKPAAVVIAVQPNVPMDPVKTDSEIEALLKRHISLSTTALQHWDEGGEGNNNRGILADKNRANDESSGGRKTIPRLVIWPESPMNFTYGNDPQLRDQLARFAQLNHTSLLFNSQESAPNDGFYNSALLINEEGRLIAQYDKIRLMPFGEYVPLPRWLPGSNQVRAIVGGFAPGYRYTSMPVGEMRAGVFICIESAYPWIARTFTAEGAEVLINISNDGYLGPTPVMKQHLANTIFRAVENGRPVWRVTNTGISAYISPHGDVRDATGGFQEAVRTWTISRQETGKTFYTKYGELFVSVCSILSFLMLALSFKNKGVGVRV